MLASSGGREGGLPLVLAPRLVFTLDFTVLPLVITSSFPRQLCAVTAASLNTD